MPTTNTITRSALFSPCGQYRYRLDRSWSLKEEADLFSGSVTVQNHAQNQDQGCCGFLMLNPSTADGLQDDPTIRRCMGFARSWGYSSMRVCNLFAYCTTQPKGLLKPEDPEGPINAQHLKELFSDCSIVVAAWGNAPILKKLAYEPPAWFFEKGKLYYIEMGKQETPKHPLYLKKDRMPVKWK